MTPPDCANFGESPFSTSRLEACRVLNPKCGRRE